MKNCENIIEIKNLSKSFFRENGEEFKAINDVSFSLKKGESIGLIGSNGSGKSTLLKILSGYLKPTTGIIKIKGNSIGILDVGSGFHPDLTGIENINFIVNQNPCSNYDKLVEEIIEFSDLQEFINKPVKSYSSGMFMRLALSTYLKMNFPILFIDEVFSTGDYQFQNKVKEFISNKKNDLTFVLASHDLNLIQTITDKSIWIKDGRILKINNSKQIVTEYLVFNQKKHLKELDFFENNLIKVISIDSSNTEEEKNNTIFFNSSFNIRIKIQIKKDIKITFGAKISDINNLKLHFDSPYFISSDFLIEKKGTYLINIKYPALILSFGLYKFYLEAWFGKDTLIEIVSGFQFEISNFLFPDSNMNFDNTPAISLTPLIWEISENDNYVH